jgi:hypothetical protein
MEASMTKKPKGKKKTAPAKKKSAPAKRKTTGRAAGRKQGRIRAPRQYVKGNLKQIGILTLAKNDDTNGFDQLRQGLRGHNYVEGKDISLHFRFADGDNSKLSALAAELLDIPVDVMVTGGTRALKELLALNPPTGLRIIQAVGGEDPGGANRTGFFLDVTAMCTGQVTELKQKNITNLTVLHCSASQLQNFSDPFSAVVQAASGLNPNVIDVSDFADLQAKLTATSVFTGSNTVVAGFMLIPNGMFFDNYTTIAQIVDAAMQTKPNAWAIYPEPEFLSAHTPSTKSRVIVSGHDVAKAYKDTADHIDDYLKGSTMRGSAKAGSKHIP